MTNESHDHRTEISNISASVFRSDQSESHQYLGRINEYYNNMATSKTSSLPDKHVIRNGSSLRQMLPIALCLFTFASVLSMLIIYIDTTEIRHQQFRLNMSRDYDLQDISQDDPVLVSYLREVHLKKYIQEPLFHREPTSDRSTTFIGSSMGEFVAGDLLKNKSKGVFMQSSMGASEGLMAPYLVDKLEWTGLIVEPDPKRYFNYGREFGQRTNVNVIHACFSPTGYTKEVTLHQEGRGLNGYEGEEVKISSVLDGEEEGQSDWFESRVKCFPLFTLMLAANKTDIDLLSLSLHGLELQILKTLPFNRVRVNVISLHFAHGEDHRSNYIQTVTRFLTAKGFKLMKVMGAHNYFYKTKRGLMRGSP